MTVGTPVFLLLWVIEQIKQMEWSELIGYYRECWTIVTGRR